MLLFSVGLVPGVVFVGGGLGGDTRRVRVARNEGREKVTERWRGST